MNTKQESTTELPLLSKLPRHELETLVNSYIAYGAKYKYVYFLMLGFVAIIVIYNIGFGGRSFSVEDAQNIENGLIGVVLVFFGNFYRICRVCNITFNKTKKANKASCRKKQTR